MRIFSKSYLLLEQKPTVNNYCESMVGSLIQATGTVEFEAAGNLRATHLTYDQFKKTRGYGLVLDAM